MTIRRPAVIVLSLAVLPFVGCGVAPGPDGAITEAAPDTLAPSMSSVAPTTTASPTTTVGPNTTASPTTGVVRSAGRPDHLRSGVGDVVAKPADVIVAPGAVDSPPRTTESTYGGATPTPTTIAHPSTTAPPPTVPPPTTVPSSTVPPSTTAPATTLPPATTTLPPAPDGSAAASFASQINGLRAADGVAALSRSADLDARALAWTEYMAGSGDFRHSNIMGDLMAGGWSSAGENIGAGPSVESVFGGLAASSSHYANMVNPSFTSLGVGVVVDGSGVIWTTHVFAG